MPHGELATVPLPGVLRSLAEQDATGCLRVQVGGSGTAEVFLRAGRVYALALPDRRPQLGLRLVSGGDLDAAALAEAHDAQRTELQGWRLGELLVHLGYVEQDVVEAAVAEQLQEAAFELLLRAAGSWRFRTGQRTREDVAPPVTVEDLLAAVEVHTAAWQALRPRVHGPDAVPVLSAGGGAPDSLTLDGDAWSLLCTVDGTSTLGELAGSSGLSLLEAAEVVLTLVDAGLVEIPPAEGEEPGEQPVAEVAVEPVAPELPATPELPVAPVTPVAPEPPVTPELPVAPVAIASRLAEALRGLGPVPVLARSAAMESTVHDGESTSRSLAARLDDEVVDGSLTRASQSLAEALGDVTAPDACPDPEVSGAVHTPVAALDEREARRRALAAQELAERHAALEAERRAEESSSAAAEELQARAAAQRLAAQLQAAAFAELSEAASAAPVEHPEPPTPQPQPQSQPQSQPRSEPERVAGAEPAASRPDLPAQPVRGADTAALLRELTSLGLDGEPDAVPEPRPPTPPVLRPVSLAAARKRKGLFGRS